MGEEKIDYFWLTMHAPDGPDFYMKRLPKDAPDELRRLIEAYSDAQKNVEVAFKSKNSHTLKCAGDHLYSTVVAVREYSARNKNDIRAKKMVIMCNAYSEGPCCHSIPLTIDEWSTEQSSN